MAFPRCPGHLWMTWTAVLASLLVSMGLSTVEAAGPCVALKQNVLTSEGCPTTCGNSPCVLYSPSQRFMCETMPIAQRAASGPCYRDLHYMMPGETDPCEMIFQCLDKLLNNNGAWRLSVISNTDSSKIVTAPVSQISNLVYPENASVVEIIGTLGTTPKRLEQNIQLDASVFRTPSFVDALYLTGLNLTEIADTATLSKDLSDVGFIHANLHKVPASLNGLDILTLHLSNNYITSFLPDNQSSILQSLRNTTFLRLDNNDLEDFTAYLPKLEFLNLSGNPLDRIPDAIFRLPKLKTLSMLDCKLVNVHLTPQQFEYLDQLTRFEAYMTLTGCQNGYKPMFFSRAPLQVCLQTNAATGTNPP